jgi:hypothetical protein
MTQPQKPPEPPAKGSPPDHDPAGTTPNGIPDEMADHEPKGTPDSGRHQTETVPGS